MKVSQISFQVQLNHFNFLQLKSHKPERSCNNQALRKILRGIFMTDGNGLIEPQFARNFKIRQKQNRFDNQQSFLHNESTNIEIKMLFVIIQFLFQHILLILNIQIIVLKTLILQLVLYENYQKFRDKYQVNGLTVQNYQQNQMFLQFKMSKKYFQLSEMLLKI